MRLRAGALSLSKGGAAALLVLGGRVCMAETPEVPRVDSVVMLVPQPH